MAPTSPETCPMSTKITLSKSLRQYVQSNFDAHTDPIPQLKCTDPDAYDYKIGMHDFEPEAVFSEVLTLHSQLSAIIQKQLSSQQETLLEDYIFECLAVMVYGSNMIEHAGSSPDITKKLCSAVFHGEKIPDDILEEPKLYLELEKHLLLNNLPASIQAVWRSFREVVQHAQAASYMINQICILGQDLTEDIILEAHQILTHGIDADDTPWQEYSGVYRMDEVSAGLHQFPHHSLVPYKMKAMIRELGYDLKEVARNGEVDAVALASKYAHKFVNIHPFIDGNGRMSRLILNSMLLKLGSFLVCIGECKEDCALYLEVAANGAGLEETYGDFDEEDKPVMHKQLGSLVLSHLQKSMHKLVYNLGV